MKFLLSTRYFTSRSIVLSPTWYLPQIVFVCVCVGGISEITPKMYHYCITSSSLQQNGDDPGVDNGDDADHWKNNFCTGLSPLRDAGVSELFAKIIILQRYPPYKRAVQKGDQENSQMKLSYGKRLAHPGDLFYLQKYLLDRTVREDTINANQGGQLAFSLPQLVCCINSILFHWFCSHCIVFAFISNEKRSGWLCQTVIRHGVCIFICILFVFFMATIVFLFLYACVIFVFVIWFKFRLFDLAQRWSAARTVSGGEAGGPKVLPVQTLYTLFGQISKFRDSFRDLYIARYKDFNINDF